jgi:hypothetical protein
MGGGITMAVFGALKRRRPTPFGLSEDLWGSPYRRIRSYIHRPDIDLINSNPPWKGQWDADVAMVFRLEVSAAISRLAFIAQPRFR